ncbi:hypothetical protein POM88_052732 [Heracleum sosnowskyi]|uniref:Uncharacterized protein n=1 Tax=Heracleum sosnowskyi TaxID=360622 RepID=A0AAD8LYJ3_9APIA|nr:hypothetical protein POM88_052732 [Heracleum sosnowskyi]
MGQEFVADKLLVMKRLYRRLDATFLESLPNNSFFRLLNIEDVDLLVPFIKSVLEYYEPDLNVFTIGGHRLGVTLQDVLYLTGLPCTGKPVLLSDVPDRETFKRVFGSNYDNITELSLLQVSDIAANSENSTKCRQIAVLATIFGTFIAPNSNHHSVHSACIQFLEEGFFIIRLPKLQTRLGMSLENCPQPQQEGAHLLPWILAEIQKRTRDHHNKPTIEQLLPLSKEDIKWRPYTMQCSRPDDLHYVRDITLMFCLNFVEHHMPHLCYRQFEEFERYDVDSVT